MAMRRLDVSYELDYSRKPSSAKRAFDIAFSAVTLVAILPLLLILMVAILIESRGNPLFSQERIGFDGRPFRLLKLRTMVRDAEKRRAELEDLNEAQWPLFKLRRDPRITRVGRLLRRTSLDELPQFLNVLWGDMSLVGPRPPLPHEVSTYTNEQARRLSVMPGLTGMWQVSGRSEASFDECVSLDLAYIDAWSFWLDIRLIAQTVAVVLTGRGAW